MSQPNVILRSERLEGRHALITGGARGIGLAIAQALAGAGAVISVISRSAFGAEDADEFYAIDADVTDEDSIRRAVEQCRSANGPIAILINNAGFAESAPFIRTSKSMWDRTIATNLTGAFLCTRAVIEDMIAAKWGRIVNIASVAGLSGAPYISAYCASKHGLVGLTRALAAEFDETGITVNAICPGYTDSPMMDEAIERIVARTGLTAEAARAELAQRSPEGRIASPQEVAAAVVKACLGDENGSIRIVPGNVQA